MAFGSTVRVRSNMVFMLDILCSSQIEACPGGRAFDHHSYGVGNLIASLDFMLPVAPAHTTDWPRQNIAYSWRSG